MIKLGKKVLKKLLKSNSPTMEQVRTFTKKDTAFRVRDQQTPIYDNRSGRLIQVGTVNKGEVFSRISDYGNWHRVQFSSFYGYIRKSQTIPAEEVFEPVSNKLSTDSIYVTAKPNTKVFSFSHTPIGMIEAYVDYQVTSEEKGLFKLTFLHKEAYVKKEDVLVYKKEDFLSIQKRLRNKELQDSKMRIETFLIGYSPDYVSAADNILQNNVNIRGHAIIDISEQIPWGDKLAKGESYTKAFYRMLHGNYFINDLADAFTKNRNIAYLEKGIEIIRDWVEKNPYASPQDKMAWHDETTSRRLKTWIKFYHVAKKQLPDDQLIFLLEHIWRHADILASNHFHSTNTNHGMFQDESLIVFSDYFETFPNSKQYYDIAVGRLKDYFDFIISKEGVHREHSPIYHLIIARMIKKLAHYFKGKDAESSSYYQDLYERMAFYATYVIKPDGLLPSIGDSTRGLRSFQDLWEENETYQFARTAGQNGIAPKYSSANFPDGGYVIIRDDWSKKQLATYIHFTAAYHTSYHKHSDDLSVWLSANGHDIITEAGPNGYDNTDPFTKFGYSSFAHNTLIVNQKGLPRVDRKFDRTYLTDYSTNGTITKASGINKRYKGIVHQRDVNYDKSTRILGVHDRINAKKQNDYLLLWNLAEGVVPKISGQTISLYKEEKELVIVDIKSKDRLTISTVFGETNPRYLGWQFRKIKQPVKSHTILIEAKGKSIEIQSTFTIK